MTITITLPPETEEKLRERAAASGKTVDGFVRQLVEREVLGANGGQGPSTSPTENALPHAAPTLDDVLAPVHKEFQQSGMTEEELTEFLTEVRDEVRREKRAGKVS